MNLKDRERHLEELKGEGLTFIPNVYSADLCKDFLRRSHEIMERFIELRKPLHEECLYFTNPFRHDPAFLDLIHHPIIDQILGQALDEDYVLINSNVINRRSDERVRELIGAGKMERLNPIGGAWHTDSRYLGGQRLDRGFGFIVITMLNDFSSENGGTLYVPKSHLRRDPPEREGNYPYEQITGKAGTLVIFDTGLWHRAGKPAQEDRWGMYSFYGPWFMKPYFRYPEMLGEEFAATLSKPLRRLLHFNSVPPLNEDDRRLTLVRY